MDRDGIALHELEDAAIALVATEQGISIDELARRLLVDRVDGTDEAGTPDDDPVARRSVDRAIAGAVDRGVLVLLAPDRVVDARTLLATSTLTRRISELEVSFGLLDLASDLIALAFHDAPTTHDGQTIDRVATSGGMPAWSGPPGWLDGLAPGDLVGVHVDGASRVTVEVIDPAPDPPSVELVGRVRAAYDVERADPHLPALADDIVLALVLDDPTTFSTPTSPVTEVLAAAGLDHRGPLVAHDDTVWQHQARADRLARAEDAVGDDRDLVTATMRVLDIADLASGVIDVDMALGPLDDELLRQALGDLDDIDVLAVVTTELLRISDLIDQQAVTDGFLATALRAARRPRHQAIARYLAALRAEQLGAVHVARDHLADGFRADRTFTPLTDRVAYYASVAGDAQLASQRWRECPSSPVVASDLSVLATMTSVEAPPPGRNDPCWCGSGKQYKRCHLDQPNRPPLASRFAWLVRKAVGFVERSDLARDDMAEVAFALTVDPSSQDALFASLEDPLVTDLVLVEGGWFEQFLATMGPLLPDDERDLLSSWDGIERTVYEVQAVDDDGLHLLDLRSMDDDDEVLVVRPPAFGTISAGDHLCARAVPDGEGLRLVGGIISIPDELEDDIHEILDDGDPIALAMLAAELNERALEARRPIDLRDLDRIRE